MSSVLISRLGPAELLFCPVSDIVLVHLTSHHRVPHYALSLFSCHLLFVRSIYFPHKFVLTELLTYEVNDLTRISKPANERVK